MQGRSCCTLVGLLVVLTGCSRAMYSASNLPAEFYAPQHVSAQHIDLSTMQRNVVPNEWLQVGDQVEVAIATGLETNGASKWQLQVDDAGRIDVPLIGSTFVAGMTPNGAAERIRSDSIERGLYVDPKVSVFLKNKRTFKVSVVGAVNEPSTYELPASSSDLLTAITMAKGLSEEASRYVEIRHSPSTLQSVANSKPPVGPDGVALASYQPTTPDPVVNLDLAKVDQISPGSLQLYDGSVVSVSREPKRTVSVLGLVRKPQQVEMPAGEDLMLLEAIAQAGGTTLSVANKVHIVRTPPGRNKPVVIEVSLADARSGSGDNIRLAAGDVVSVEETGVTMAVQTIQSFFRVGFNAAMPGF